MKALLRNPISLWLQRLVRSWSLEHRYRRQHLKIGYMSTVRDCDFGVYNTIFDNVSLHNCTLGDFTFVASDTKISQTKIGRFCSIGPDCKIGLGKHPSRSFVSTHPAFFSTLKQAQITFVDRDHFTEYELIEIGNDVWLGANVIVVDGVRIGDGAIVAAGSVVTKNVPPYAIVGGVPAKVIRSRFKDEEIEKLLANPWWNLDADILRKAALSFRDIDDYFSEEVQQILSGH